MIEPTPGLDALVKEEITPQLHQLRGIVEEIIGQQVSRETLRLSVMSIVSQCVFYHHCQPVIQRLFPLWKLNAQELEKLATHIAGFSLSALKALPKS